MQLITTNGQQTTMSSREIADLTGSAHDNVLKTIRRLVSEGGVFKTTPLETAYTHPQNGQIYTEFRLNFRDTVLVISGYSAKTRAKIIDRWQELEAQAAAPAIDPAKLSRMQLIELAMQAEQERIALEGKVVEMAPKVAALDRIATADGSMCLTDAAKQLQIRPKDLIGYLATHHWIYKRAGCSTWIGYQDRIQTGLLEHKSHIVIDGAGVERVRDQVRITAKGLTRLAEILEKEAA